MLLICRACSDCIYAYIHDESQQNPGVPHNSSWWIALPMIDWTGVSQMRVRCERRTSRFSCEGIATYTLLANPLKVGDENHRSMGNSITVRQRLPQGLGLPLVGNNGFRLTMATWFTSHYITRSSWKQRVVVPWQIKWFSGALHETITAACYLPGFIMTPTCSTPANVAPIE